MTTYRYYSLGNPGHFPASTLTILGWSRTRQAAMDRHGTMITVYASTRQQAARIAARRLGISRDKIVHQVLDTAAGTWSFTPILASPTRTY